MLLRQWALANEEYIEMIQQDPPDIDEYPFFSHNFQTLSSQHSCIYLRRFTPSGEDPFSAARDRTQYEGAVSHKAEVE
jgi:hypothetical protein